MLKKAMFLAFGLIIVISAGASAQTPSEECLVGVYADAAGTETSATPIRDLGDPFFDLDVYYVIRAEDFVQGVAWYREVTGFAVFSSDVVPNGTFLEETDTGWRLGLGLCRLGFGGVAITLMKETLTLFDDFQGGTGLIQVIPNTIQDPQGFASYSDCTGIVKACDNMGSLVLESVVPASGTSFGAVKALFK